MHTGGGGGGRLHPILMQNQPPSYLSKLGAGSIGGSAGGFPRWGGLRATHYYHMHTSGGDVCLGVWSYGGDNSAFSSLLGTACELGKSSECRIFTSQQMTFV